MTMNIGWMRAFLITTSCKVSREWFQTQRCMLYNTIRLKISVNGWFYVFSILFMYFQQTQECWIQSWVLFIRVCKKNAHYIAVFCRAKWRTNSKNSTFSVFNEPIWTCKALCTWIFIRKAYFTDFWISLMT